MKCKAINCGRSDVSHPGLSFHRFPRDQNVRQEWMKACIGNATEEDILLVKFSPHSRICSLHFPNGKRNANGTWNIPIAVTPPDEEWQEREAVENIYGDENSGTGYAASNGEFTEHEIVENIEQVPMLGGDTMSQSRLRGEIFRLREQVTKLKRSIRRWRSRYGNLVARKKTDDSDVVDSNSLKIACKQIFNDDQLKLLSGKIRQVKQWSEATLMDSLQIRFACQDGYDKLIKRGFPLPSSRTLLRRIADDHFPPAIRSKQRRPTPRDFGRNLKTVTLSQYMAPVPNSSYSLDDQEHLVGMADFLFQRRKQSNEQNTTASDRQMTVVDNSDAVDMDYEMLQKVSGEVLDRGELNALFYVTGYVLQSLANKGTVCKQCVKMTESPKGAHSDYQSFTFYRANTIRRNIHLPSIDTFNFFKAMEIVYRNSINFIISNEDKNNVEQKVVNELALLPNIFHCSSFKMTLVRRYVSFRLKSGQKRKQRKKKFDSRSMLS